MRLEILDPVLTAHPPLADHQVDVIDVHPGGPEAKQHGRGYHRDLHHVWHDESRLQTEVKDINILFSLITVEVYYMYTDMYYV